MLVRSAGVIRDLHHAVKQLPGGTAKLVFRHTLRKRHVLNERITVERIDLIECDDRNRQAIAYLGGRYRPLRSNDDVDIVPAGLRSHGPGQQVEIGGIARYQDVGLDPFYLEDPAHLPGQISVRAIREDALE